MLSTEELVSLAEKKIDLVFAKLSLASSLIEALIVTESVEDAKEDESLIEDLLPKEEDELLNRVNVAHDQIESAREYICEILESVESAKNEYLKSEQTEQDTMSGEDREAHEILDTVSDEDEIDVPSPNESK